MKYIRCRDSVAPVPRVSPVTEPYNTPYDADVIVIGAGPIGLTTACALRHHGVSCRLLEQRTKPSPHSRANNIWSRPQELLHGIGARDALAEKSYRIERINNLLNGHPTAPLEVARVASPFPDVLYSGQGEIEEALARLVGDRGGSVERGRKVTAIEQDDAGVTVTVVGVDDDGHERGEPERLRSKYLVGADGAKGFVRKSLGLDFETEKLPGRANRQMDAKLKWRRSTAPDQLWFFVYRHGLCGVMPVWGGYHRLFFLADDAGVPEREPTLEEIQAVAREVTGDDTLTLSEPIWASFSRFQHGTAPGYAKGRVFLAGDAGHYTLPIGGQGMNAGLHDAVGVAWRLAMAVAGHAGSPILDSYGAERQAEHARLDKQQAQGFRNFLYRNRVEDAALSLLAESVPKIAALLYATDDLQQMSVAYPDSPLNDEHMGLSQALRRHAPHAGDRAPDADVSDGAGGPTTLHAHATNPDGRTWGWTLLAFDGRKPGAGPALLAAVAEVAPWDWVRPRLVVAGPVTPDLAASPVVKLSDLDGRAHGAYSLEGIPALVLVRPDGHIAFRAPADRADLLKGYCEKVFA